MKLIGDLDPVRCIDWYVAMPGAITTEYLESLIVPWCSISLSCVRRFLFKE